MSNENESKKIISRAEIFELTSVHGKLAGIRFIMQKLRDGSDLLMAANEVDKLLVEFKRLIDLHDAPDAVQNQYAEMKLDNDIVRIKTFGCREIESVLDVLCSTKDFYNLDDDVIETYFKRNRDYVDWVCYIEGEDIYQYEDEIYKRANDVANFIKDDFIKRTNFNPFEDGVFINGFNEEIPNEVIENDMLN